MEIRVDGRSEQLIEEQLRQGRFQSPEEVVAHALETLAGPGWRLEESERLRAVQEMLEFATKRRFMLGEDIQIRDLLHEGHKY